METANRKLYETTLHIKKRELLEALHQRDGLEAEAEPDVFDEVQRALDRALVVQALDRTSALLREVKNALARLADGSYGRCLRCEEPISAKRLAAVPWAQLCLKCQEEADREARERPAETDLLRAA